MIEFFRKFFMSINIQKNNKLTWKYCLEIRRQKARKIVLFHSGNVDLTIEEIHKQSQIRNKAGIGHHFAIDFDGNIIELRPIFAKSQCLTNWSNTICILLLGDLNNHELSEHQEKSLKDLISYIKDQKQYVDDRVEVKTADEIEKDPYYKKSGRNLKVQLFK